VLAPDRAAGDENAAVRQHGMTGTEEVTVGRTWDLLALAGRAVPRPGVRAVLRALGRIGKEQDLAGRQHRAVHPDDVQVERGAPLPYCARVSSRAARLPVRKTVRIGSETQCGEEERRHEPYGAASRSPVHASAPFGSS